MTANLASLAGIGQIVANLVLTPLLLQRAGVAVALLVTPAAYAVGQALVLSSQSVDAVFVARVLDFVLRYTVNGAAQISQSKLAMNSASTSVNATNISHVDYKGVYLDSNNMPTIEKELDKIPEVIDFFGNKSSNHYHPHELSAEMMASHYFNNEPHSKAYTLFKKWLDKIE